jgi:hypothetical protein
MKLKREELFGALSKVRPALSNKGVVEQTDHFIFDGDFIRTYNDEIAISYPFKSGFRLAVKADEFFSLISKITIEEIGMELSGVKLLISIGKDEKAWMVTAPEIKCPSVEIQSKRWFLLPKNFSDAIHFCSFSAGGTASSPVLSCLWVNGKHIFSTDRFRATKYRLDADLPEFLLPAKVAQKLSDYSPTHYILEKDGAWVHFKNRDGLFFSSRVIDEKYFLKVAELFPVKGDDIDIPSGLKEAVGRGSIFSSEAPGGEGGSNMIEISVSKSGKLFCKGEGTIGGDEKEFKLDYKKRDFKFKVSADALSWILDRVKKMVVSGDKLYFDGGDFEHVISLAEEKP